VAAASVMEQRVQTVPPCQAEGGDEETDSMSIRKKRQDLREKENYKEGKKGSVLLKGKGCGSEKIEIGTQPQRGKEGKMGY